MNPLDEMAAVVGEQNEAVSARCRGDEKIESTDHPVRVVHPARS